MHYLSQLLLHQKLRRNYCVRKTKLTKRNSFNITRIGRQNYCVDSDDWINSENAVSNMLSDRDTRQQESIVHHVMSVLFFQETPHPARIQDIDRKESKV